MNHAKRHVLYQYTLSGKVAINKGAYCRENNSQGKYIHSKTLFFFSIRVIVTYNALDTL